ncbi:YitT family protein [Pseudomonas capsici]|uniref:YitT family protein n=1 Tax=Pseudomonas capsici TaxID=2810614 RepID=UPI0019EE6FA6|nr:MULTISPECIES: YitT family protein [Pseudomonas]MCV4273966.1 YitT family protein [Pseudomonas capsici]GFM57793.1 membrane protein [Pseudomonas cichorii]GFM62526.1 membrane protein [Pseudomonas cichorii]
MTDTAAIVADERRQKHTLVEDLQAILTGTLLLALGMNLYAQCHFLTGGAAGMALLGHYLSDWSVGTCFFLVNLPFYYIGYKRMGLLFILRTFAAITSLSLFSNLIPHVMSFATLDPLFAAVLGGCLIGVGFILVFRHGASLGGVTILALYWQARYGISAGKTQMGIDCLILLAAFLTVSWSSALYSVLGALLINLIMMLNFKKTRYNGFS